MIEQMHTVFENHRVTIRQIAPIALHPTYPNYRGQCTCGWWIEALRERDIDPYAARHLGRIMNESQHWTQTA